MEAMQAPSPDALRVRDLAPGEENLAMALAAEVFTACVAPLFPPEGVDEFLGYATGPALFARLDQGHFCLVADDGRELAGMIEIRNAEHVCMLFVRQNMQRTGLGRILVEAALERCLMKNPVLRKMTVNASPNAVDAYRAMGFAETGPEQTVNGITFVPMALNIQP